MSYDAKAALRQLSSKGLLCATRVRPESLASTACQTSGNCGASCTSSSVSPWTLVVKDVKKNGRGEMRL